MVKHTKLSPAIPRAIYYLSPKTAIRSFLRVATQPFSHDVSQFEKSFAEFIGCQSTVATSHARVAFYAILKTLKLEKGEEVLMSGVNLPDMINMIKLNDLVPRIFDYEEKSFNFSIADLKKKMTGKTRVLFITVLAGINSNIEAIIQLAKENQLILIVDQTQSMGLKIRDVSLAAQCDFSIYSLCDLKDIHTHRGGVIAINDLSMEVRLRKTIVDISLEPQKKYFLNFILEDLISSILLRRTFFHFFISPFLFFFHYFGKIHLLEDLTKGKGLKIGRVNLGRGLWGGDGDLVRTSIPTELLYRFTSLQASLGLEQLSKVNRIQNTRISHAKAVLSMIGEHNKLVDLSRSHLFWKFPVWVEEPKISQRKLQMKGIDSAPTNLPNICSIESFKGFLIDETPHAEKLVKNVLFIPVHYYLTMEEVMLLGELIGEVLNDKKV